MECKKTKYATQEYIDSEIKRNKKRYKKRGLIISSYKCPICNLFHLTKTVNYSKIIKELTVKNDELTKENIELKKQLKEGIKKELLEMANGNPIILQIKSVNKKLKKENEELRKFRDELLQKVLLSQKSDGNIGE